MRSSWRFYFILAVLIIAALILTLRMFELSVFKRGFLVKEGEARIIRTVDIPAYRGMITDRNGTPLAVSAPVDSIWVNPKVFAPDSTELAQLAGILKIDAQKIAEKSNPNSKREFTYLARSVAPELAEKIRQLNINGIYFQREYRRFYPSGEVSAQLLGFTNIDDQGQEGLELAFDHWLKGVPGKRQVIKDRLGHIITNLDVVSEPEQGKDLTLSIDARLQHLAYDALMEAIPKFNARSASIVILNPKTGEVLAMVNAPSYNPNTRSTRNDYYRNRAVTDLFEPGSTMKPFSVLNGLASGKYTPNTLIDTNPGFMTIGGYLIKEAKNKNYGVASVSRILQKSSNIGVVKITLSLPPESLFSLLSHMGFGEKTDSGFPGERSGVLIKERFKRPTDLATMAYGYGLSITALQLAQAYSILAAHGVKHSITFVKTEQSENGQQIIASELNDHILTMLKAVTEDGGGINARIPGYHIGGKTGTAYTIDSNGYNKSSYTSSFVGIAPLSNPQLVGVVVLHDVKGEVHFGSQVSAPIFAKVISGALRYANIPPDNLSDHPSLETMP